MDKDGLSVSEARELLAGLGLPLSRQRIQQLCESGALESWWEPRPERRISRESIERLVSAGLPRKAGRPRKAEDAAD